MKFGHCKECRDYKLLVEEQLCRTHADITYVHVGFRMMNVEFPPAKISTICEEIAQDVRTVEKPNESYDAIIVIAELEVIVEDADGDPVKTFDYNNYNSSSKILDATRDAVKWSAQYFT